MGATKADTQPDGNRDPRQGARGREGGLRRLRRRSLERANQLAASRRSAAGVLAVADGMGGHRRRDRESMAVELLAASSGVARRLRCGVAPTRNRRARPSRCRRGVARPMRRAIPQRGRAGWRRRVLARARVDARCGAARVDGDLRRGVAEARAARHGHDADRGARSTAAGRTSSTPANRAATVPRQQALRSPTTTGGSPSSCALGALTPKRRRSSKYRHVITQSIGFERDTDADHQERAVVAGDCFVLCSDGMSNYVEAAELERIMAMTWYRRLPETLIELANDRGGDDNITVVVGLVANAPT